MPKKSGEPRFPLAMPERKCVHCATPATDAALERCVICHNEYCADCSYKLRGRRFCSHSCADIYMYGDSDDIDEDVEDVDDV